MVLFCHKDIFKLIKKHKHWDKVIYEVIWPQISGYFNIFVPHSLKHIVKPYQGTKYWPGKLFETGPEMHVCEDMGKLGNTGLGYRRNKWMIAAEPYIMWHFQINRSAVLLLPITDC